MADAVIGSAYLQVIPKMSLNPLKRESAIAGTASGESFNQKFGSALGSAGSIAKTALKGVAVAAGAASAAVGIIGKNVYDSYSSYEQLEDGMKKLFGKDVSTVMANADKAFITAGKSANEYMEGVTSFAASLKKSVGGDTKEAARLADVAMTAISDNVNTFGTDAQSVQAAVQGLAKGNYSMLDNLSLGFAGTQQGMVDLINESGVLDHKLEKTSELADVGFGTMVEAIQAVQKSMGIAGTTAKEAMGTLEGSMTAAKSAISNVFSSIGTGDPKKLRSAIGGFVDSVFGIMNDETGKREGGVIANLVALAQRSFQALAGYLPSIVNGALSSLPDVIEQPLRGVINRVTGMFGKVDVAGTISGAFKAVAPVVTSSIGGILTAINRAYDVITTEVLPVAKQAYDTIAPVITKIYEDVQSHLPKIQETFSSAMGAVRDLMADIWPDIQEIVLTATSIIGSAIEFLWPIVKAAFEKIQGVAQAVWPYVSMVIKTSVALIKGAVNGLAALPSKVNAVFSKVKNAITTPINAARDAVSSAIERIKSIVNGAHLSLPHFALPHFRIDGGELPWGIGGKGHAPSVHVDWYAKGGWIDSPTIFAGVGERGGEFVWPSYAPYLDQYADALANRINGGGGVNVYLTYNGSGDADELVRTLTRDLRMMRMTGAI